MDRDRAGRHRDDPHRADRARPGRVDLERDDGLPRSCSATGARSCSQYASANRDAREMAPAWTLNVPGNGGTDPKGGGTPEFGNRARTGVARHSGQRVSADADERRVVGQGRPLLPAAGRAPKRASGCCWPRPTIWRVPVGELVAKDSVITHAKSGRTTTYGKIAHLAAGTPHPNPEADRDQVAGSVDADGHRAEEPRRAGRR